MSKMQHVSLTGKIAFDTQQGEYLIDGFSILDVLELMNGLDVQLELVGYEKAAEPLPGPPPPDDIVRKMMGGD